MGEPRSRRTQAERSATTRTQILETTVECLFELGYAKTSTVEVCKRGGISRGALLHHYPSKEALVIATVEYIFDMRVREFRSAFAERPIDTNRTDMAIDLLWRIFSGPTFYVWLELLVASRTDPGLNAATSRLAEKFSISIRAVRDDIIPREQRVTPDGEVGQKFIFAVLTGLAMDRILPEEIPAETILSALKVVSQTMRQTTAADP